MILMNILIVLALLSVPAFVVATILYIKELKSIKTVSKEEFEFFRRLP